jgi:hypothetical protein
MTTTDTSERKYKQGFIRKDGRVFHAYQRRKNGSLRECWMTPEAYEKYRLRAKEWIKNNAERHRENVRRRLQRINEERFPNSAEITESILRSCISIDEQIANEKKNSM